MSGLGIGGLVDLAMVLASGFILCDWEPWRGYLRRQPPPIPYFTFLAVGVIWWVAVAAVIRALSWTCGWSSVCIPTFGEMMGFPGERRHGVNVLVSAMLFWIVLWLVAGKIWSGILEWRVGGQKIAQRIAERSLRNLKGWEFEKMVNEAVSRNIKVMMTLSNRKVYIGAPSEISRDESGRERWIGIVPWQSGYRCEKTGKLILTTDYGWMFQGTTEGFNMCIPVREVVSFQFFDQSLYERFQSRIGQAGLEGQPADSEGGERDGELERRIEETRSARFAADADERGREKGGR